jgi:peptide/nickel transport system substrate-binding protein
MDAAADLLKKKADVKGDEVKKFLDDFYTFKPTDAVVSGPYKIDPKSVTEAQVTFLKNPKGYNADKVGYDKLIMYFGETVATVPLILSGDVDYATHGFPPANITTFKALPNYKLLGGTTATGPGLWFNQTVYPLNKVEVRQAFAYIIDRKENATIAFGDAGKPIQYMAGFTDAMVPGWLAKDTIAKLNPYAKDLKKAEELLTKAGIKTTVRGYQSADRATVQSDGKYQILVDLTTYTSPPHPQTAFNYVLNTPRNNPNPDNKAAGMNYSWKQTGPDGKDLDLLATITSAAAGLDNEAQKPYIATLAQFENTNLPYLQLWERIATDPINVANQTGWLPFEDKIYQNNQGSDNYVAIQLLNGTVKPTAANTTKKFASAYPYTQPPKGSLNLFATDSVPTTMGATYYPLEYPPLFWYMWADNTYAPVLAEKYELKTNK